MRYSFYIRNGQSLCKINALFQRNNGKKIFEIKKFQSQYEIVKLYGNWPFSIQN